MSRVSPAWMAWSREKTPCWIRMRFRRLAGISTVMTLSVAAGTDRTGRGGPPRRRCRARRRGRAIIGVTSVLRVALGAEYGAFSYTGHLSFAIIPAAPRPIGPDGNDVALVTCETMARRPPRLRRPRLRRPRLRRPRLRRPRLRRPRLPRPRLPRPRPDRRLRPQR